MRKLVFKGGYGEHGRSCFLMEYGMGGRYYMVDCGIMDSDTFPYPNLSEEELRKVDYLFLTHCHKDHSGAISYILERGFSGWLVTSQMTLSLENITYDKIICLPLYSTDGKYEASLDGLKLKYGRSGHCPGGLWFRMEDAMGSCFFSGDYQANTLLYACDSVKNMQADIAIVDCAHYQTEDDAENLRSKLQQEIHAILKTGRQVVLPVPKYGRGIEMLCMLKGYFPNANIKVDTDFVSYSKKMLKEGYWYKESALEKIKEALTASWEDIVSTSLDKFRKTDFDILLIADTHLQKETNRNYVQSVIDKNGMLIITGRIKKGSLPAQLYEAGKAKKCMYPHHQSMGDVRKMIRENDFKLIYPYHNPLKEVFTNF